MFVLYLEQLCAVVSWFHSVVSFHFKDDSMDGIHFNADQSVNYHESTGTDEQKAKQSTHQPQMVNLYDNVLA